MDTYTDDTRKEVEDADLPADLKAVALATLDLVDQGRTEFPEATFADADRTQVTVSGKDLQILLDVVDTFTQLIGADREVIGAGYRVNLAVTAATLAQLRKERDEANEVTA